MPVPSQPDLTEFFKYSRPKKPPCKVGVALGKLRGDTKTQLVAALDTDTGIITNGAIITWVEKRVKDLLLNTSNVTSHRAKRCTCYDE